VIRKGTPKSRNRDPVGILSGNSQEQNPVRKNPQQVFVFRTFGCSPVPRGRLPRRVTRGFIYITSTISYMQTSAGNKEDDVPSNDGYKIWFQKRPDAYPMLLLVMMEGTREIYRPTV
jgi:hypothetical protein